MITPKGLEEYRYRGTALEQQFKKLKMWQNKIIHLQAAYGSARAPVVPILCSICC